ncbi:MAG TPA: metallopeptidase family protein [Thermoanaerobaculia bacterium]|nr:metallopeptidase family protein [Thermoanaerobaculia bacterium]
MTVPRQEFERLVEEALASLPKRFADLLENVAVIVEEEPSYEDLDLVESDDSELLGIFRGIPMTQQSTFNTLPSMPNQVAIFRGPILRVTRGRRDAVEQIRETVIHELGHYFGLDDDAMSY